MKLNKLDRDRREPVRRRFEVVDPETEFFRAGKKGDKDNGTDKRDLYQNTKEDWRIFI